MIIKTSAYNKILSLMQKVNFDRDKRKGKVIVYSFSSTSHAEEICKKVISAGLAASHHIKVTKEEEILRIASISDITIGGIILHDGIPVYPKGVGVLQVEGKKAIRFVEFINYRSTTIYPEDIFLDLQMTSVTNVVKSGEGRVIASVIEVPEVARMGLEEVLDELDNAGFRCIIDISKPDAHLLGIPISRGRTGVAIISGVNPLAAIKEEGLKIYEWGYSEEGADLFFSQAFYVD
ncbi:MAG: NrpR regulatory domain-containing protein [Candidatus Methanospirareceae archaeon]